VANFGWLNAIPNEAWDRTATEGARLYFSQKEFFDRSSILDSPGNVWDWHDFQPWASTQERRYQVFPNTPHGVMVLASIYPK
jgi:hypothetical protein